MNPMTAAIKQANCSKSSTARVRLGRWLAPLLLLPFATLASADDQHFDIPAQPLADALKVFADQARMQLLYQPDVVNAGKSSAVVGDFDQREALQLMLKGTGLEVVFSEGNAATVRAARSDAQSSSAARAGVQQLRLAAADLSTAAERRENERSAGAAERSSPPPASQHSNRQLLEEIVVTAQKREERLQDVPIPVTTVSGDILTSTNQLRVEDYYRTVPGLSLAPRGNGGEPEVAIRGVTTGGSGNPTVGIVVDEVSYGASVSTGTNAVSVADIDPGDVQRVEVLRGPQGTLYGASSIGGLLKFITIDPSVERLSGRVQVGSATVRGGDDLGYSVRGNINLPMGDTLAMRVSGFTARDPGYIDNAETGQRDVNSRDSEGGRVSFLWRPSDDLSVKLSALLQDSERTGTNEVDITLGADDLKQGFLRDTGVYRRQSDAYSATVVGNLGSVEITSATGYSKDDTFNSLDTTSVLTGFSNLFFGVDRGATLIDRNVEKFSQELRARVPLGDRVTWLVGAFYTDEEIALAVDNQAARSDGQLVGSLYYNAYGIDDPRGPATFEEYAAFTTLTLTITDRVDVQVGGRYSDNSQATPTHWSGPVATFVFGQDPYFNAAAETSDSAVTYLVTPRFKISPELMLYARFASGYRPGGINVICGHPEVPCGFQEDTTENYDIGAKGSVLDGRLTFDASLYYVDWSNVQIADLSTSDFFTYTDNVARARSRGAELSLTTQLLGGVSLSGWAAYNDAELTRSFTASSTVDGQPGDRLPYGSRVSGSMALNWEFLLAEANANLGATLSYAGDRKGRFQQTGAARETYPSYTQLDLHAKVTYGSWDLSFYANNATDKRGVLRSGIDYFNTANYVMYIQPRTIGVSLSKTF